MTFRNDMKYSYNIQIQMHTVILYKMYLSKTKNVHVDVRFHLIISSK